MLKNIREKAALKSGNQRVPAAAVIEEGCTDEDRIIRSEARHRLRNGKGVRVFSRPGKLKEWLEGEGLTMESRQHLFTDAGQLIPGFSLGGQEVEFFVHSPFGKRLNEVEVIDRNIDSLVVQATFTVNGVATRVLLGSDLHEDVKTNTQEGMDGQILFARVRGSESSILGSVWKPRRGNPVIPVRGL
jgi:hypothetical protein